MADHQAGHLSRHVMNEMEGRWLGHDGLGGEKHPLSAPILFRSENFVHLW